MDKIIIENLEVYGYHGVFDEEKKLGQKFLISITLDVELSDAAVNDDLEQTINYGALCSEIEEAFVEEKFNLIESAAEKVAKYILINYSRVQNVKVIVKKPWAPIKKPVEYAAVQLERKWHKVYIGVGSNIGNKEEYIKEAKELINQTVETKIVKESKMYVTEPWGYKEQDDFLNCVWEVKTLLSPSKLIKLLLSVEKKLDRERTIKWGPRTIDLDVLLYDEIVTCEEDIVIPHPRMHQRLFVIEPLCDIAPYKVHPLLNKRMIEIKEMLVKDE